MSPEHLAVLASKIDSEQALKDLEHKSGAAFRVSSANVTLSTLHVSDIAYSSPTIWWMRREYLRIRKGVYQISEITSALNMAYTGQMAVHVSKEDPMAVAYTASVEDGLRDKQIRCPLGRFLRKYFLQLTDEQVAAIEAMHRAEMNGTFKLATTADEIQRVYTTMEGDTGCMRYTPSHFGLNDDVHPSHAYEAQDMGVAYTEDEFGRVKSRSVVWVNPADASDKRFVRLYGDPVLGRILVRAGYRMADLSGARLKAIPRVTRGENVPNAGEYVVPWLDGPGGNQSHENGSFVMLDDEEGWIRVLSLADSEKLANERGSGVVVRARTAAAFVKLKRAVATTLVSDMTGRSKTGYNLGTALYWDSATGTVKQCFTDELNLDGRSYDVIRTTLGSDSREVHVYVDSNALPLDESFYCVGCWIDNEANRIHCGYVHLSEKYYPDMAGQWWRFGDAVSTDNEEIVKRKDCFVIIPQVGEYTYVHNSEVPALRKKGHINSLRVAGMPTLIHRDRATRAKTIGGSHIDTVIHAGDGYVQLFDGAWAREQVTKRIKLFGINFNVLKARGGGNSLESLLSPEFVLKAFNDSYYGKGNADMLAAVIANEDASVSLLTKLALEARTISALFDSLSLHVFTASKNSEGRGYVYARVKRDGATWAQVIEGVAYIKEHKEDYGCLPSGATDFLYLVECILPAVVPARDMLDAAIAQCEMESAGQMRLEGTMSQPAVAQVPTGPTPEAAVPTVPRISNPEDAWPYEELVRVAGGTPGTAQSIEA